MHIHTHTHTQIHTNTYTHTNSYTYTHTHIPTKNVVQECKRAVQLNTASLHVNLKDCDE